MSGNQGAANSESFVSRINAADDDDLDEDDDDDYDGVPNKTETEFVKSSNSIKLMCAMCVGVKDDKDVAIKTSRRTMHQQSSAEH
jgi:hypothetical protein